MDGTAFPAWVDVGSFGGLTCAVVAASGLAIWALVFHRGTPRQSALAILVCLGSAAAMIFPVWWDQTRFVFFGASLDVAEVTLVLAWITIFGWTLPLGILTSYVALAEPHKPEERAAVKRSPQLEAAMRLAIADPARYDSINKDDAPWAQLAILGDDETGGGRPLILRKRLTLIGREVDNDIVLNDERISRHHAEIRLDHRLAVLLDFGSMNGTLINHQRVSQPVPLKRGDIVELGARRYLFSVIDAADGSHSVDTAKVPGANGAKRRQTLPPSVLPTLVVVQGEAAGSRWTLLDPVTGIGRDSSCQIQLPDATVSRRHAQIVRQSDGYYASDLESNNGTHVNDEEITTPRRLRNGDLVQVGTVALRFVAPLADDDLARATTIDDDDAHRPSNGHSSSSQTTVPLTHEMVIRPTDMPPDASADMDTATGTDGDPLLGEDDGAMQHGDEHTVDGETTPLD
ncbi:MAG TPA: FHA domain-containing protein [Ktedonobacterales bacterium]|nr:FHA domain-containing protein [Ktedonobacterales bacterium]